MQYVVKNWRTFQHYKDRNPPWIKLHFSMLSSADWVMLSDSNRVLAVACMLIASRNEGLIDGSEAGLAYMQRVAYLSKKPDLTPLINCGFLESASGCKQMLADASSSVSVSVSESNKNKTFELPDWIPAELWGHYEEMRKKKKKPLTDRARTLAVTELSKLREQGHDVSACIDAAVFNAWQSFYPPKNSTPAMKVDL